MRGTASIGASLLLLCSASVVLGEAQLADPLNTGRRAMMQGRINDAVAQFHTVLVANPRNGDAHLLLCRTYYSERSIDPAVRECEAALQTLAKSSDAQNWMGKVYGLKAEHAGPLSGYGLARKVKTSFEAAVSLDPTNGEAIDDLGDYYLQAPAIVGGGTDKAKALADRVKTSDRALRLNAAIAEKEKDYSSAERDLKEHIKQGKGRPDTWLDLAAYYQRRGQTDAVVDALHHAQSAAHGGGAILVAIAEMLYRLQREPALAMSDLRDYLKSSDTDDSAPPFRAYVLLGKMLAAQGDRAAARIEFGKALALAPDYEPAQKALASL